MSLAAVLLGVGGIVLVLAGASGAPVGRAVAGNAGVLLRPVVVTARPVAVGTVLTAVDVTLSAQGTSGLPGLLHSVAEAVGRRTAVALPAGVPLVGPVLLDAAATRPGHRVVRLQLDASSLPPSLEADELIDVLASTAGQADGGRVATVATGRLLAMTADGGAGGGASPPQATLTLDVDTAGAERLLWAESFAKALHVLARPEGDDGAPPPPGLDGLGPPVQAP